MFHPSGKQFSGESCAVLSVWTTVVSMEISLAAQNARTHTHAQSHCRDVMLPGNMFKIIGTCNWFSADSKVRGCWSYCRVDPPPISSSLACSGHLCSQWTCALWMYSWTKWRGTKACTSQHLVLLAKATKESKELLSQEGLSVSPLAGAFLQWIIPRDLEPTLH